MQAPTDFPCIPVDVNDVQAALNTSFQLGVQYGAAIASSNIATGQSKKTVKRKKDGDHGKVSKRPLAPFIIITYSLAPSLTLWSMSCLSACIRLSSVL